jgi:RNA polymerase sigma-70 factor, ECF subfamily
MVLPAGLASADDERALVRRAQKGAPEAYEELVRRHQRRVHAVAAGILRRREDAEDIAQQVFLKAYMSLKRFDLRSAFSTWLYKITVNECWDHLRKKRVRPLVFESDLNEQETHRLSSAVATGSASANPAERALLGDLVEGLLGQLSEMDRAMLVLKEVEGLSIEEIAAVVDLNMNTVKVRLFRVRARLGKTLREQNEPARAMREGRAE